ncbi:MAG: hypothetical protein AB7E45_05880, partial [Candidatus Caldatribacteriota bacterium]
MKEKLEIDYQALNEVNQFLTKKDNPVIDKMIKIVDKYGGPQKINDLAQKNGKIEVLMEKLRSKKPEYVDQLNWLME